MGSRMSGVHSTRVKEKKKKRRGEKGKKKKRRPADNGTKENVPLGRASLTEARVTRSLLFTPGAYAYAAWHPRNADSYTDYACTRSVRPIFLHLNLSNPNRVILQATPASAMPLVRRIGKRKVKQRDSCGLSIQYR